MAGFVGAVAEPIDGERSRFFGTAFAVFNGEYFLTPDHVLTWALEHEGAEALYVLGPGLEPVPVAQIIRHPSADLALLRTSHGRTVEPFVEVTPAELGAEVTLSAWRPISQGSGLARVATAVSGFGLVRPPKRPRGLYEFGALGLVDAPGKGFSGSPVADATGALVGVSTQTMTLDDGSTRGVALSLSAPGMRDWLESAAA
jgi:S1-C subfamily serine protease